MGTETLKQILELFSKKQILYRLEVHDTIPRSSLKAAKIRGSDVTKGAKALILLADDLCIQAIVPAHKKTNFAVLKKICGAKKIRLAEPETVLEQTSCVVGSVPPLGVLWNLKVFLDKELLTQEEVVFSAGTLTESIYVSPQELVRVNVAHCCDISKD